MIETIRQNRARFIIIGLLFSLVVSLASATYSSAITKIPDPDPKPGSYGLEATKPRKPPVSAAKITSPHDGASFSKALVTVKGLCPKGLLVQLYDNNVMVGSTMCKDGSFTIQISLFAGDNDLQARVFDEIGQEGPESNKVSVTFTDTDFDDFGDQVTLTSNYGRRSANVGHSLNWPLQLTGGTGPYAISIDWGDGTSSTLKSLKSAGDFKIHHVYDKAGVYTISIKATDSKGVSAFLQVVAVSSGKPVPADSANSIAKKCQEVVKVWWIPVLLVFLLLLPSYWLGRRSKLVSIRNQMEKDRIEYEAKHKD